MYTMSEKEPDTFAKWKYSAYSAVIFLIVTLPIFNNTFLSRFMTNGTLTMTGHGIRTLLFLLIIRGIMEFNI